MSPEPENRGGILNFSVFLRLVFFMEWDVVNPPFKLKVCKSSIGGFFQ